MNTAYLLISGIVFFAVAYRFYARKISKNLGINDSKSTPAHTMNDGVDYHPAKMPVLLGHHFSSIAGAAPIIGPITAAVYGWAPVFLWIIFGAIFLGAVHDLTSLIASVRHSGRSIGEAIHERLGTMGSIFFLIFSWSALILVVAVFMAVVAKTFVTKPETVTASLMYLILALLFGFLVNKLKLSFKWMTLIFLPLLFLSVWIGVMFPMTVSAFGITLPIVNLTVSPITFWIIILTIYIFIASVTPVWILLQPRDYLSSFLLYGLIAMAIIGTLVARPEIKLPAFTSFTHHKLGPVFPMLFVVVACGAISGFHSLVASGTSSKQLDKESDAVPVGYGSMLIEGLLAIIALVAVARLGMNEYSQALKNQGPINVFANGIGACLNAVKILPEHGIIFATLAVSAFALTTLDTATRLSRFCLQELCTKKRKNGSRKTFLDRYTATFISAGIGCALALSGQWKTLWPMFGAANQLLAALALITVSLWLFHIGKNIWFTIIPACIMFTVTLAALVILFIENVNLMLTTHQFMPEGILSIASLLLFSLAIVLLILTIKTFKKGTANEIQMKNE